MNDPLVQLARGQLDRMLARLRAGVTITPAIEAALARLRTATAELVAWAQTSPVRVPGDSLYTSIGPWVQAVDALQAVIDLDDPDEGEAVVEVDHFTPPDTSPEEWIAGVEVLLAELDERPNEKSTDT